MTGIREVVESYLGEPVKLQKDVLDRKIFKLEFGEMYEQLIPVRKLERDIEKLVSGLLSSYKDVLPQYEISSAVTIRLARLRLEAENTYVTLRAGGFGLDTAFEVSLVTVRELIQGVQAGNIQSHQFYSGLDADLSGLAEEGIMPHSPL